MPNTLPVKVKSVRISSGPNKTVFYPQIINMKNQQLQRFINQTIIYHTQQLIDQQDGNMPSTVEEMIGTYEIKNNQRQVLSLSLSSCSWNDVY